MNGHYQDALGRLSEGPIDPLTLRVRRRVQPGVLMSTAADKRLCWRWLSSCTKPATALLLLERPSGREARRVCGDHDTIPEGATLIKRSEYTDGA